MGRETNRFVLSLIPENRQILNVGSGGDGGREIRVAMHDAVFSSAETAGAGLCHTGIYIRVGGHAKDC